MLADLHIHSEYSRTNSLYRYNQLLRPLKYFFGEWKSPKVEDILRKANKVGLKMIAITDHDETKGAFKAQKLGDKYRLLVIPGIEISTNRGHILGYGLKKPVSIPQNRKLSLDEALKFIDDQGGIAAASHPFYHSWLQLSVNRRTLYTYNFDAVETFNANVTNKKHRRLAKRIAKERDFSQVGGSDAHTLDFIGYGVTEFSNKISNIDDALGEIKKKKTKTSGRDVSRLMFLKSIYREYFAAQ